MFKLHLTLVAGCLIIPALTVAQSGAQGPVITLEPDKLATGPVQIVNGCRSAQTFAVTIDPKVNWARSAEESDEIEAPGGGKKPFNITVSSRGGIKPGEYHANVIVTCVSCPTSVPPCGQDRKVFPITLVIPGEAKPEEGSGGAGAVGGGFAAPPRRGGSGSTPTPAPTPVPASNPNVTPAGGSGRPIGTPEKEVGPNTPTVPKKDARSDPSSDRAGDPGRGANPAAGDAIPVNTPDSQPILPLVIGGLLLAGLTGGLLLGRDFFQKPVSARTPGRDVVPGRDGVPTRPPDRPEGTVTPPADPGTSSVPDEAPGPTTQDQTTKDDPGGDWDATFDMPQSEMARRAGGSPAIDQVPDGPPVGGHSGASEDSGQWDATFNMPEQDVVARPLAHVNDPDPGGMWDATFSITSSDFVDPATGKVHPLPPDLVPLGRPPDYPGSQGGMSMPLYPPGREPRLYVNPRTGEQQWVLFGDEPPDGWVANDGVIEKQFTGPGSDYVGSNGKVVHVPDSWVKLGPAPAYPGSYGGLAMPEYVPGREPRLYVDPKSGEQRWFDYNEKPPAGWVRRTPLLPIVDLAPQPQAKARVDRAQAPPKPPPPVKSIVEELKPPQQAQPAPQAPPVEDHKPGDVNEGGGHTFSRGTTKDDLKKANTLTDEELAKARQWERDHPGAAPRSESDIREKKYRDALREYQDVVKPNRDRGVIGVDPFRPDPPKYEYVPYVPKTPLEQERMDFIDRQIAVAEAAGNDKAKKIWSDIKREFGGLNKDFLNELDDLRTLDQQLRDAIRDGEGPTIGDWLNYILGPEGRSLDEYGGIAKAARQVAEHQYLIYLYRTSGSTAVNHYREQSAKDTYYQGLVNLVRLGAELAPLATQHGVEAGTPEMPDTFRIPKPKGGPAAEEVPGQPKKSAAGTSEETAPGSRATLKYTPEDEAAAKPAQKEPTKSYGPEDEAAAAKMADDRAARQARSEAPTQKTPAKPAREDAGGAAAKGRTEEDPGNAAAGKAGTKPEEGAKKVTPEEQSARSKAVDEDWKKWEKEAAEAEAQGKDPISEAWKGKKFKLLPKEEKVPDGNESKGVPPEQQAYPPLTKAQQEAWRKAVSENWDEWERFAKQMESEGKDPVREFYIRKGKIDPPPSQKNVETKPIRGGDTQELGGQPQSPLPETRTRIVKPSPEPPPKQQQMEPMKLPGQKGVAFGPRKAILEKYGPAVEKARAAAGPGESCEKAKLSLLEELKGQGAYGEQQKIGPLDHEAVFTADGHVLDPVARQVITKNIVTEAELADRGLLKAVNDGIFTRQQWEDFKRIGNR